MAVTSSCFADSVKRVSLLDKEWFGEDCAKLSAGSRMARFETCSKETRGDREGELEAVDEAVTGPT